MLSFMVTPPTEIYTPSLHDALPICRDRVSGDHDRVLAPAQRHHRDIGPGRGAHHRSLQTPGDQRQRDLDPGAVRSEEHTSELQSRLHLVCRLLVEKKKRMPGPSGAV